MRKGRGVIKKKERKKERSMLLAALDRCVYISYGILMEVPVKIGGWWIFG